MLDRVCDVPIAHLPFVWPKIEQFIVDGLSLDRYKRFEPVDVLGYAQLGQARIWVSYDTDRKEFEAAMVTQIIDYPRLRECRVWLIGGRNMKAWLREFESKVEAYAKSEGCRLMSGGGRRGWCRAAGYSEDGINLTKELH